MKKALIFILSGLSALLIWATAFPLTGRRIFNASVFDLSNPNTTPCPTKGLSPLDVSYCSATKYKNKITATISDGILIIQDINSKQAISSFSLNLYGLDTATTRDIFLMDMNFDNYLDVAIHAKSQDGHYHYHAFLYNETDQRFSYQAAFSYLNSPEYSFLKHSIRCTELGKERIIYDTYHIVENQPEIFERIVYTYQRERMIWRMEHYTGKDGELTLDHYGYYTSHQVRKLTGQCISDN